MATATREVDEIRRQMAQIRQELHKDMQGVVAGAEAAADWRHYVRLYPWAALGLAFALGFYFVPKRRGITKAARKAAEETAERLKETIQQDLKVEAPKTKKKEEEKQKARFGLVGTLLGMAVPVVTRVAQSYASHFVEQWVAQQQAGFGPGGPGMAAPGGPAGARPGGPAQTGRPGAGPGRPV